VPMQYTIGQKAGCLSIRAGMNLERLIMSNRAKYGTIKL
jgi:hypothetical protein